MKYLYLYLTSLLCFVQAVLYAQNDSINTLEEVKLIATSFERFGVGRDQFVLSDSIINTSGLLLSDVLEQQTGLYFKQNGYGMVSSPTFRGTTAQQTAVLWNGININSLLNAQSDFNTINSQLFDQVAVQTGGGSVLYGSGAIGGSIHLQDEVKFDDKNKYQFNINTGSFSTHQATYKNHIAHDNWVWNAGLSTLQSDNDYPFPDQSRNNINGRFAHYNVTSTLAYKINHQHRLILDNWLYDGKRNLSLIRPTDTRQQYNNMDFRNVLKWQWQTNHFKSVVMTAFLNEEFEFVENINRDQSTFGKVDRFLARHDFTYKWERFSLQSRINWEQSSVKGTQLDKGRRTDVSYALLGNYNLSDSIEMMASLRAEASDMYTSPLLFSLGANWNADDFYKVKINFSRNFRQPSFNDLFWEGSGNLSLAAEQSYQWEFNQQLDFAQSQINISTFYNDISDMIQWLPDNGGVWRPNNIRSVTTYGLDFRMKQSLNFFNQWFDLQFNYSWTTSIDEATNRQMIYVPKHSADFMLNATFNALSLSLSSHYTGAVFARTDHNPDFVVGDYWVQNIFLEKEISQKPQLSANLKLNNFTNTRYESVLNRPMPGIHFLTGIQLEF